MLHIFCNLIIAVDSESLNTVLYCGIGIKYRLLLSICSKNTY